MSMSLSVFLWVANKTSVFSPPTHKNTLIINVRPCFFFVLFFWGGELTSKGSKQEKLEQTCFVYMGNKISAICFYEVAK